MIGLFKQQEYAARSCAERDAVEVDGVAGGEDAVAFEGGVSFGVGVAEFVDRIGRGALNVADPVHELCE